MVRRLILIVVALLLVSPVLLLAQDGNDARVDYNPGTLTVSGSVGLGYGFSLALYPGIEFFLAQKDYDGGVNLDFGIAGRGLFNRYSDTFLGDKWGWNDYGLGGFGTVHLSFMQSDDVFSQLSRFDFYVGLGIAYSYFDYFGPYDTQGSYFDYSGIGFSSIAGVNYFFNPRLAVMFEGAYWGYTGGTIGILYKL